MNSASYIIGIDEAGRGPLAGPIVVAGVRIEPHLARTVLRGIRDSKKLTRLQREEWFRRITGHPKIQWASARVSHVTIDRINITQAGLRGVRRVYRRLSPDGMTPALLDGGLFLPPYIQQETIIKGDEKIPVIAAASIIAKVTRDRLMCRMHRKYPQYGFHLHKGYGTKLHRAMIREHGRCEIHRRSFHVAETRGV